MTNGQYPIVNLSNYISYELKWFSIYTILWPVLETILPLSYNKDEWVNLKNVLSLENRLANFSNPDFSFSCY